MPDDQIDAQAARTAFEERWQTALGQPETLPPVSDESPGARTGVAGMLERLQRIGQACADEALITAEEGERIAAAAEEISTILGTIDEARLDEIARNLP